MAGVSEVIGAGAALASIVGLGVQIYLVCRERRRRAPLPVPADSLPSEPARHSGVGAFLLGVWQLLFILNGYGWVAQPAQLREYSSLATDEVPGHLRMLVVVLAANAAWAALLLRRQWPASGQGFAVVKDRFWFYLAYAPLSAVSAAALLIVRSRQIF